MSKRKRRNYTKEFKADCVRLVKESSETLAQVARNIGVGEQSLRNWVKQYDIDTGIIKEGYTTAEKEEIRRLKRELRDVTMERDFLKKAAAFFARETENLK